METDKFKILIDFAKFFLGSVVVVLITFWVNSGFKDREIALEEQSYLAQFKNDALNEDIEVRRRLAEYFSLVTLSERSRIRWDAYLKLINQKQADQAKNLALISKLRKELDEKRTKGIDATELQKQIEQKKMEVEQLKRELEPSDYISNLFGAVGWIGGNYIECPKKIIKVGAMCFVNVHSLNFRSGPGSEFPNLARLHNGTHVSVLKLKQNEFDWVKVVVTRNP